MYSVLTTKTDLPVMVPPNVAFSIFSVQDGPLRGHLVAMSDPFASYRVPAEQPPTIDNLGMYRYEGASSALVKFKVAKPNCCTAAEMFSDVVRAYVLPLLTWHPPVPLTLTKHTSTLLSALPVDSAALPALVDQLKRRMEQRLFFDSQHPITVPTDIEERLERAFGKPR